MDERTDLIVRFIEKTRPEEYDKASSCGPEMESLWEELTIFAQRTLFSPENQYALEQLKPPGLMKRLWRLLFGGQPKAVPDSSRWTAIFKDPETQKIYEVDVTKMYVSGI